MEYITKTWRYFLVHFVFICIYKYLGYDEYKARRNKHHGNRLIKEIIENI